MNQIYYFCFQLPLFSCVCVCCDNSLALDLDCSFCCQPVLAPWSEIACGVVQMSFSQ